MCEWLNGDPGFDEAGLRTEHLDREAIYEAPASATATSRSSRTAGVAVAEYCRSSSSSRLQHSTRIDRPHSSTFKLENK